jgi:hypothetical protein
MFGVGTIGRIGRADYSAARGGLPLPILDQLGIAAAAAYSLRQVRSAASLACRVRRSSDNAELNIGFTASGDLDIAALLDFVGSSNGFVTTWYDQSGDARNLTQTTAGSQPRIVNNGAIVTQDGRPAVLVDNNYMSSQSFSGPASYTLNTVYNPYSATSKYGMAVVLAPYILELRRFNTANNMEFLFNGSITGSLNTMSLNAQAVITATVANADQNGYVNGLLVDSKTEASLSAVSLVSIGNRSIGEVFSYVGTIQEITLFNSTLSTTDRQTLDRNQGQYYGITVA